MYTINVAFQIIKYPTDNYLIIILDNVANCVSPFKGKYTCRI